MISLIILFFCLGCGCNLQDGETFVFTIEKTDSIYIKDIKLKKKYAYQKMEVITNTLDDSCKIGIIKIPPRTTGVLYKSEFFFDTLSYSYYPYRATKGKLVIKHSFFDY